MGFRAVRSIRATSHDGANTDDDDVLIQLDLIPRTRTKRLEVLRARVAALLDPKGPVSTNIGSTGALAKYATRQKDAIDAELKLRQAKAQITTVDDMAMTHPTFAKIQNTSCQMPLPSTSAASTCYNEAASTLQLVVKRPRRRRLPLSETKSWGQTMLVGGGDGGMVERARRLAVAKKVEPIDEPLMLERRREERRQAAIERLRSRQQRRQQHKAARNQMQMSLKKHMSNTTICSRRRSEGSDSESVSDSDGDDELLRTSSRMTSVVTTESVATLEKKTIVSENVLPISSLVLASDIEKSLSLVDEACGRETMNQVKDSAAMMEIRQTDRTVVTVPDKINRVTNTIDGDDVHNCECAKDEASATSMTQVASPCEETIIDESGGRQDIISDLYSVRGINQAKTDVGSLIANDAHGFPNGNHPEPVNPTMSARTTEVAQTSAVIIGEPQTDVGRLIANDAHGFLNGNTPECANTNMWARTTETGADILDESQTDVGRLIANDAHGFRNGNIPEPAKTTVSAGMTEVAQTGAVVQDELQTEMGSLIGNDEQGFLNENTPEPVSTNMLSSTTEMAQTSEVIQDKPGEGEKNDPAQILPSRGDGEGTKSDEENVESADTRRANTLSSLLPHVVDTTTLEIGRETTDCSLLRCMSAKGTDELRGQEDALNQTNAVQSNLNVSETCEPTKQKIIVAKPSTSCRRQSMRFKSTALSLVNTKCDSDNHQTPALTKLPPPKTRYENVHPFWWSIFSQWSMLHLATCSHLNKRNTRKRPPPGDVQLAMNRQWRLYTVYETIMTDYAAVFSSADRSRVVYDGNSSALHFRVNSSRPEVFDIVTHVLTHDRAFESAEERWIELPAGLGLKTTWNLLWTWSKPRIDYSHLLAWQRVNHYPKSKQLTRKDLLARSIAKFANLVKLAPDATSRRLKGAFDVTPATFLLPQDYCALVQASRADSSPLWIVKPVGLSRGRGISLVADIEDLTYAEPVVVQEYVSRPLLLEGHKFDLRLYVLVTSFSPLEAFIYRRGFARLATRAFSLNETSDKFVHLTNASVQKKAACSAVYPLRFASVDEAGGTKCSLEYVWRRLRETSTAELNVDQIWRDICLLVLKSLVCVEDDVPHQPNSFEVFGYDVLIDADLRPWLLEVNASPSMARESNLDCAIKEAMIRDTVTVVDPLRYDRSALVRIMDRRLRAIENQPRSSSLSDEYILRSSVDTDLNAILVGATPRPYGCPPRRTGDYEMLAPGRLHDQVCKIKRAIVKQNY